MNKRATDVLVVGFALFAMFFGAGNLLFPPKLGLDSGASWLPTLLGFLITGVGMPLLGIIAVAKAGGSFDALAGKVGKKFSIALATVIVLAIGPLLAIPRTAATTFELSILAIFPFMGGNLIYSIIFSLVYFAITLFFVFNLKTIVDNVGKFLTPVLLLTLAVIIFKGVMTPIGTPITTDFANPFSRGFVEGYQTMDALASVLFAGIIIGALVLKGYVNTKDQVALAAKAGMVAAAGLGLVYAGLLYLGATASGTLAADLTRAQILIAITQSILGNFGKIVLGICVAFACLTTAIGLTAVCGEYFSKLSNGKLSYKSVCWVTAIISMIIANIGVEAIVYVAIPPLILVYPVVIVLIVMSMFSDFFKVRSAYAGAVLGAFAVSIFDAIAFIGIDVSSVTNIFAKYIPLYTVGFGWIVPAVALGALFALLFKNDKVAANTEGKLEV